MFFVDLLSIFADLCDDIRFGKRYGFGSFLWSVASFLCLCLAGLFFSLKWKLLGVLTILGAVICFICCGCRTVRDVRKKRTETAKEKI